MDQITQNNLKEIVRRALDDFPFYVNNIYRYSFPKFISGEYVTETAKFMQQNPWHIRIGPRNHFKSEGVYAFITWWIFKEQYRNIESHYFSFSADLAYYHIAKIKERVRLNPFFNEIRDEKSQADSVIKYTWNGDYFFTMQPWGLTSFKRGLHCNGPVVLDDPMQDPSNKLEPSTILKVNQIFVTQIMDIPLHGAPLVVVGTPQTNQDFFFNADITRRFGVRVTPAITSFAERKALWPEWMDFPELMEKKIERGKYFNQEYMCTPVHVEDAFFNGEEIDGITNIGLENLKRLIYPNDDGSFYFRNKFEAGDSQVEAALDIGKKVHPSHLVVFQKKDKKWRQLVSFWMDGWPYTKQVEFCKAVIGCFSVDHLYYDNTRGELESFAERGELPPQMKPVTLTSKKQFALATEFQKAVHNKEMELLDELRQRNQVLAVNNSLQAIESPEGHGDSFWSIAMIFEALSESQPAILIL